MMEVKSEYKMTEFDKIPNDWVTKTLESISKKIVGGGTPSRKEKKFYVGDIPWVTVKDMHGDFYQGNSEEHINEEAIKMSASNLIEPDNIIIATRISLGKGFINTKSIAINQDLKAIYLKNNEISNPYFLYWYLSNAKYIKSLGSGTTVKGIRLEQLIKIKIPIPLLKEQHKIAKILSTIDEQIEQTDQLIEKTKELKKGLMQQLLTKGIGHKEFKQTELGEIPVEWKVQELDFISEIIMGQSPDSSSYNDVGEGLPFYQGKSEFGDKYPTVIKWCSKPSKIAERNDILFTVRAPVGDVNMCEEKSCIGRGIGAIRYIENTTDYWFLYYSLQYSKDRFINLSQGSTFKAINGGELRKFTLSLPTLKEQQKIAEILSLVDEDIEGYEEEKVEYEELKKGLMQQLLTGETRVKVD